VFSLRSAGRPLPIERRPGKPEAVAGVEAHTGVQRVALILVETPNLPVS